MMFVKKFHFVFLFVILFEANAKTKYDGKCKFTYNGESHDGFRVINKLEGSSYTTKSKVGGVEYTYKFAICDDVDQEPNHVHVGLLQTYGDPEKKQQRVVGRYNVSSFMKGGDWLMLSYGDGDPYNSHCGGSKESRSAVIMVMCDPKENTGKFKHIEEMVDQDSQCYYLFELSHEAACDEKTFSLSVGSILCIVFFSLVAVYLIAGFIVQRVRGAQSWEQVPNHSFWKAIGNYAADGCNLVFRSSDSAARQYRSADGMDQEIPRSTGEPDDHLLSM